MVEEELDFLREIERFPMDEMPRLIYADWLEERGDERADYLRMECELHRIGQLTPEFMELTEKLRAMREDFDPHWLVAVGRTRVGNCTSFSMECPNKWEWLVATENPLVRFCDHCRKRVHYCTSLSEAQRLAWEGECVAIDSAMTDAKLRTREAEGVSEILDNMSHATLGEISFDDDLPRRRQTLEDLAGNSPRREPSWWQRLLPWSDRRHPLVCSLMLSIAQIVPVTEAEGPGKRFALWFQGCPLRCPGCCNPEMLPFEGGSFHSLEGVLSQVLAAKEHGVEGITLLGGEPVAHATGAAELAAQVQAAGLSVMVFSGYTLEEIQAMPDPAAANLLRHTDILVDGPYLREQPETRRRWIGSANQRIHFLTDRYRADDPCWLVANTLEIRLEGGEISVNGFPAKQAKDFWRKLPQAELRN